MDFRSHSGFGADAGGVAVRTENHQHGGRRALSLYCAISLAERRNRSIAPYEPNPAMTIEAQFASFNFLNPLIWADASSAARAPATRAIDGRRCPP
jgi:hypothetical protein